MSNRTGQGINQLWELSAVSASAGGLGFEREESWVGSSNRHYLSAGGQTIGVLISTGVLPDLGGALTQVVDWTSNTNNGTDRGYTGHEHLDDVGLVYMNGRIYDPTVGVFLQGDPFIQDPGNLQNFNRYGYCYNNPLTCTDPTGYFSWRKLFRAVVGIVIAFYAPQLLKEWMVAAAGGSPGVFVTLSGGAATSTAYTAVSSFGSLVSSAASGFMAGAVAGGSLQSGVQGAFSAGMFNLAGDVIGGSGMFAGSEAVTDKVAQAAIHGVVGCVTSVAGGGKCGSGALSAAFSKTATINGFVGDEPISGTITSAVVGGTASALGGGSFANGARTAAFGYLFNNCLHNPGACARAVQLAYERVAARFGPLLTNIVQAIGESEGVGAFGVLSGSKTAYEAAVAAGERTNLHHAIPKYLGGPEVQEYVSLPVSLHTIYHRALDEIFGRWESGAAFNALAATDKSAVLGQFDKFTVAFDRAYGTNIMGVAYKNGFSTNSATMQIPTK